VLAVGGAAVAARGVVVMAVVVADDGNTIEPAHDDAGVVI